MVKSGVSTPERKSEPEPKSKSYLLKHNRPYEEIGASFNGNEGIVNSHRRRTKQVVPGKWRTNAFDAVRLRMGKLKVSLRRPNLDFTPKHSSKIWRIPIEDTLVSSDDHSCQKYIVAASCDRRIKIRVPKSTYKPPKLTPSQQLLQQTCTCGDDESICSDDCGIPGRHGYGPQNKLNFQIPDDICEGLSNRTGMNSELVYCSKEHHDAMCDICNVTPKDAPKGVKAQKKLHPDKDIFVLKIGKQTDEPNRTGNIEVELVTPRAPAKPRPVPHNCQMIQCEDSDIPCCTACRGCHSRPKRRLRQARCFNLCD